MKINRARDQYLNIITNENTLTANCQWINKFIMTLSDGFETNTGNVTVDDINTCLQRWWQQYENSNSYNLGRQLLIRFIKWGSEEDGIFRVELKASNTVGTKKPNQVENIPYSNEERHQLIKAAQSHRDMRYRVLVALLIIIAPRASEVAHLQWKDVFRKDHYVFLKRKGGEIQSLPISNDIYDLLAAYYEYQSRPNMESYLFAEDSKPIPDRHQIYNYIKSLADEVNVDFRGVHLFRHSLANEYDDLNVQNSAFLENFAWQDERMKQRYVRSNNDTILKGVQDQVINKFNIMEEY